MSQMPSEKHPAETLCNQNGTCNDGLNHNEEINSSVNSLTSDIGVFGSPESMIAMANAYSLIRDRYNKLKLENLKLKKQIQKHKEVNSNSRLLNSYSETGEINSAKNLNRPPPTNETTLHSMVSDSQPLSASTLINELEQLRERLDKMSKEAQSYVDSDLKDMMVSVIPKLKELERQCSSLSDDVPKSLMLAHSRVVWARSVSGETISSQTTDDQNTIEKGIGLQPPSLATGEGLVATGDFKSEYLEQNNADLMRDIQEIFSSVSSQHTLLDYICNNLKQQNTKLMEMKAQNIRRPCFTEPDRFSEVNDWSFLPNEQ